MLLLLILSSYVSIIWFHLSFFYFFLEIVVCNIWLYNLYLTIVGRWQRLYRLAVRQWQKLLWLLKVCVYNFLRVITSLNFCLLWELLFVWIHNVKVYQSIYPYDVKGGKNRYVTNRLKVFLRKFYWYTSLDTTNLIISLLNYCCYQKIQAYLLHE